jgi:glycosyltransferase involved in cell wall biosynthesis
MNSSQSHQPSARHIRVLHIGPDRSARGGIASLLHSFKENGDSFRALGIDMRLISTTRALRCGAVVKLWVFIRALLSFIGIAARSDVDLVHIHSALKGSLIRKTIFSWLCMLMGIPYLFHIHNGGFFENYSRMSRTGRYFVGRAMRNAVRTIVLSHHMKAAAIDSKILGPSQCALIYNGIADPLNGRNIYRPLGGRCVQVIFLGLLAPAKGVPTLLDAIASLKGRCPAFLVTVYGSGDVAEFHREVATRNLNDVVTYGGWIGPSEKPDVLASADVFVLPSHSEGFSVAILEAMAYGLPIVSTSIPGVVEAVQDGAEALLVLPGDSAALAKALGKVIGNEDLRVELGEAARRRYLGCFSLEKMAMELGLIYRKCLQ